MRDIRKALGLSPSIWLDLLRATFELALARYRLGAEHPKQLLLRARQFSQPSQTPAHATAIAARVAFAIPRVAARLPWRADCFIQAMAAQRWLQRKGIPSALMIVRISSCASIFSSRDFSTLRILPLRGKMA